LSQISIEEMTAESLIEHIRIGSSEYSSPEVIDFNHVAWKHLNNLYGPSVTVSLRDENGQLIGHSFLQPRRYITKAGEIVLAATITDLVIMPIARNAAALISMVRAAKGEDRFKVVVHTSNDTSDLIYRKLFKFPVAFSLVASALPLRISNVLVKYLSSRRLREFLDFLIAPWGWIVRIAAAIVGSLGGIYFGVKPSSDAVGAILKEFKLHAGPHFERTEAYIDWRFCKGPIFKGQLFWVWSGRTCLGYIAVRKVSIKGLDVLVILDSVIRRPLSLLESVAIKLLCAREAVRARCDLVFCLFNKENDALSWWSSAPFIQISDKYLPHSTPIFVHVKGGVSASEIRSDIFLTLADLDYF